MEFCSHEVLHDAIGNGLVHYLCSPALQRATHVSVRECAEQLPGSRVHHEQAPNPLPCQLLQRLNR